MKAHLKKIPPILLTITLLVIIGGKTEILAEKLEKTSTQLELDARLIDAVKEENTAMAENLVKLGANPSACDEEGVSALFSAILHEDIEMVRFLVGKKASLGEDSDTPEALCHVASSCDLDMLKILVEGGADINAKGSNGYSVLYHAITSHTGNQDNRETRYKTVRYLISRGARPVSANPVRGCQNEILSEAVETSDIRLIKLLIKAGADVNVRDSHNRTPLICLFDDRKDVDKNIFLLLLEHGADTNHETHDGETAMSQALYNKKPGCEIVKTFLKHGYRVREKDLMRAAELGDPALFALLDARALKTDYPKLLEKAAEGGNTQIIRTVLDRAAKNHGTKAMASQALWAAAKNGRIDAVRLLLKKGADLRPNKEDRSSSLVSAAGEGHVDVVRLLVEHGADIHGTDTNNENALLAASKEGHTEVVSYLLEKNADTSLRDSSWNMTPLLWACNNGHFETAKILVENGADIRVTSSNNESPLELSLKGRDFVFAAFLISRGAVLEKDAATLHSIMGALMESGDIDLIKALAGKDRQFKNMVRQGAVLPSAVKTGNADLVTSLLGETNDGSPYLGEALLNTCRYLDDRAGIPILDLLLTRNPDKNFTDANGWTPLMAALDNTMDKGGNMAERLLSCKVNINTPDEEWITPLMLAVRRGDARLIEKLLEKGARVNYQHTGRDWNKFGSIFKTNLWIGVTGGFRHPGRFFSAMGEAYRNCQIIGDSALLIASTGHHAGFETKNQEDGLIIRLLLEKKADVNIRDIQGNTPLILASAGPSLSAVEQLIHAGADIAAANENGTTALHAAAEAGNAGITTLLLENGAEPEQKAGSEKQGATALILASQNNHGDVVQSLLEHGADMNAKDEYGLTALEKSTSSDVKAILTRHMAGGHDPDISRTKNLIDQTVEQARQKKRQQDLEEKQKKEKSLPEGTYVYQFILPFGEPMAGCRFAVEYDGKKEVKTTDEEGQIYFHNVSDKSSIKIDTSRFKGMLEQ